MRTHTSPRTSALRYGCVAYPHSRLSPNPHPSARNALGVMSSHRPLEGKADAVFSTASGAVQGAEACTPPSDQGTASDERRPTSTVCGRGGVTGRRDVHQVSQLRAPTLKTPGGFSVPPTARPSGVERLCGGAHG